LEITEDEQLRPRLAEPFATIVPRGDRRQGSRTGTLHIFRCRVFP
jgi:hypothetical protein